MTNRGPDSAYRSERAEARRRWPWLSREDHFALTLLEPAAADAYEHHIRREVDEERAFREHVEVEADLPGGATLELFTGERIASRTFGAGGGRRRPTRRAAA